MRPAVDRLPVAIGERGLRPARWAKRFLTFADLPEEAAFRRSYTLYDAAGLDALVGPELAPFVDDVIDEHREVYEDTTLADHVNRMCLADARLFLPGLNLAYTDRASMAASTEVRVPFVDVEVVRAAFSLPGSAKVQEPGREGRAEARRGGVAAEGDRAPAQGVVRRADPGVDLARSARARRRRARRRRAGRFGLLQRDAVVTPDRRGTLRPRRSRQADLAVAQSRALVRPGPRARRAGLRWTA